MQRLISILAILVVVLAGILYFLPIQKQSGFATYSSATYGLSFEYPATYMVMESDSVAEDGQHAIVLTPDTPENRELLADPEFVGEGPPTITITVHPNTVHQYTARAFIGGSIFSNFALSDGATESSVIGGEVAISYHATGLYENDNVVVALPDYVYMFTAFYDAPTDQIRADLESILDTVQFAAPTTGPTPAPGSTACTMEAKICPDGSAVGRTGPNCEFAACPATGGTTLRAAIGQTVTGGNVSLTPLSLISDSRCPIDVQCIWAGTLEAKVRIESGLGTSEMTLELGKPVTTEAEVITLTEVSPAPSAGVAIPPSAYRFTFEVKAR